MKKWYNVLYSLNGEMLIEADSEEDAQRIAEDMLSVSPLAVEVYEVTPGEPCDVTIIQKPVCQLVGQNGNIFNLLGIARRALRNAEQSHEIQEMTTRVCACKSYDEALAVIQDYVTVI